MLRFVIFATLIAISLAKVGSYNNRFRRNEGNENLVKYYRPKYVYKFHEEDEDEESAPHHGQYKTDYKHYFNNDEDSGLDDDGDKEEEVTPKHYSKPEKVTYYGYQHDESGGSAGGSTQGEGVQQDTEHHVEIKHEHGTSHQSFKMHHFHPAQVFIKKQDLQYLKKPIEIGVTKHQFKFTQPKKTSHEVKVESPKKFNFEDSYDLKDYKLKHHSYKHKEYNKGPKYEYHMSKEMEVQPKKLVYHEYIEPATYERKVELPKKYDFKEHYQYSKEPSPKIEYHVPKEYQHYHHQHQQQQHNHHQYYHKEQPKPQALQHYTVYRGNNDSNEEQSYYQHEKDQEQGQGDAESQEAPHDIHVYH